VAELFPRCFSLTDSNPSRSKSLAQCKSFSIEPSCLWRSQLLDSALGHGTFGNTVCFALAEALSNRVSSNAYLKSLDVDGVSFDEDQSFTALGLFMMLMNWIKWSREIKT